jgi:hypothetical protein
MRPCGLGPDFPGAAIKQAERLSGPARDVLRSVGRRLVKLQVAVADVDALAAKGVRDLPGQNEILDTGKPSPAQQRPGGVC